jgi:hypothetical protein
MNAPASPSLDEALQKIEGYDLEVHQARWNNAMRFAAATFFSNDHVSLGIGMEAVKQTYPDGQIPANV